jgi:small subunit ribosomal protein S11
MASEKEKIKDLGSPKRVDEERGSSSKSESEKIEEVVEKELEESKTAIPTSKETKTKKKKEEAAEKVAEEVAEPVAEEVEKEIKKEEKETKETPTPKKDKKTDRVGIAYIKSSGNNTIVHITDLAGNTISRVSGGMVTKHSRLKANPTIAMFVAKRAAERPKDLGFTKLYVRMKGKTGGNNGPGANSAVKSLGKVFDLISILDATKVPRGGPKKKGGRRGRRV